MSERDSCPVGAGRAPQRTDQPVDLDDRRPISGLHLWCAGAVLGRTAPRLSPVFQSSDMLEGVDVVWTEQAALGPAGQWLRGHLIALGEPLWRV